MDSFWQKQDKAEPLFPDILWSRPENRRTAGKLLIVGGNAHGFSAVQQAFAAATEAGVGAAHVLLPEAVRSNFTHAQIAALGLTFAPSTPSGSFGRNALNELLIGSNWADGVLLAGDLGRNSETSMLLNSFAQKYPGLLTLTKDAVDYFLTEPHMVAERPNTTLVLSLAQLQKLGLALKFETPFLLSMGLVLLARALHDFTSRFPITIVTKELEHIVVAHDGKVTSTKLMQDKEIWRVGTAAKASVFWLQNKNRPLEAITSSLL